MSSRRPGGCLHRAKRTINGALLLGLRKDWEGAGKVAGNNQYAGGSDLLL